MFFTTPRINYSNNQSTTKINNPSNDITICIRDIIHISFLIQKTSEFNISMFHSRLFFITPRVGKINLSQIRTKLVIFTNVTFHLKNVSSTKKKKWSILNLISQTRLLSVLHRSSYRLHGQSKLHESWELLN